MSSPARITVVHVITGLGMGGAERMLSNIVLAMDRTKFCNIIVSLNDLGHWGPILKEQGILVYTLNMRPSVVSLTKLWTLYKLIRQHKPQCIQAWMYHANLVALIIGKLAGVKQINWNIRCSLMDLQQYRFSTALVFKLGAWLAKFPNLIINNSNVSIQQHSASGYNSKKWLYIPNGYDLSKFQPNTELYQQFRLQHNLPADAILIGIIARYDPMKDHATFLKAASILAKENAKVYFICAGRDINMNNQNISNIIEANSLQDRVLLLDQVNNVHELLPALDYLTQTSVFGEGFPNVVAEAMACGVQCFVTDVGESLEIIGNTGFQIPIGDPLALAKAWKQAIALEPNKQIQSKVAARQRIVDTFALQRVTDLYSDCYAAQG